MLNAVAAAALAPGGVLLRGEAGTGKATLARSLADPDGTLGADLPDLDCRDAAGWADAAVRALADGLPVVLRHVEDADAHAAAAVCGAARRAGDVRLAMTTSLADVPPRWEPAVDVVVDVPPLRERRTDIPVLVREMVRDRVGPARDVRCSPAALAVLVAREWPGNLTQLRRTVATALVNSMHSDIAEPDVPGEERPVSAYGTRRLGGLELAAREAILNVLRSVGWKREAAAAALGISRATIYRKMRALRITTPTRRR